MKIVVADLYIPWKTGMEMKRMGKRRTIYRYRFGSTSKWLEQETRNVGPFFCPFTIFINIYLIF